MSNMKPKVLEPDSVPSPTQDEGLPVLEPEVLEAVEKTVTTTVQSVIRQEMKFHSGPLPAPEDFAAYNAELPGAANRLLEMAEKEQSVRHAYTMEMAAQSRAELQGELMILQRGQVFAFVIVLLSIFGTFLFIYLEKPIASLGTVLLGIVTVIGSGVLGRRSAKQNHPGEAKSGIEGNSD